MGGAEAGGPVPTGDRVPQILGDFDFEPISTLSRF
jgi:hypothetical protein